MVVFQYYYVLRAKGWICAVEFRIAKHSKIGALVLRFARFDHQTYELVSNQAIKQGHVKFQGDHDDHDSPLPVPTTCFVS